MPKIRIIFESRLINDGRSPNEQIFVEVEDEHGNSINAGEWAADGEHESLTIDLDALSAQLR